MLCRIFWFQDIWPTTRNFVCFCSSLMCNVLVIPIFGSMMMVDMRRKDKTISGEIYGKRYVSGKCTIQPAESTLSSESFTKHHKYDCARHLHVLSAPCSLFLYPKVSLMDRRMRLAIILLYQIIQSRKKFRSFFWLDYKVLGPALFSNRQHIKILGRYFMT